MANHKRRQPNALSRKAKSKKAKRRALEDEVFVPRELVTRRLPPVVKSKHRSYFEFVHNSDKKRKLEFEVKIPCGNSVIDLCADSLQNTLDPYPPHGFEFVPVGNPELTTACKELSREQGLKIFIVAVRNDTTGRKSRTRLTLSKKSHEAVARSLATQMNRVGYHFDASVVREAKASFHHLPEQLSTVPGIPEPIPERQDLYYAQADAVLRDLFPRIPNTDRQTIILRSFTKGASFNGEKAVGRTENLTLSRRVQLAVLAHIRHNHTLYDDLLKRMPWNVARKAVQPDCLDILVKWRGDEESGRDQLDEILREVVIISDSEDEDSTEDSTDGTSVNSSAPAPSDAENMHRRLPLTDAGSTTVTAGGGRNDRRGFERYRRAWEDAVRRSGETRHDAAGSFHDGVGAAFRDAPEPRMTHDAPGYAPAPNGYVRPGLQVYRTVPVMIAPPGVSQEVSVDARRDEEAGSRLPRLPSGSSNRDMLAHSSAEVGQTPYMPRAYPSLGTESERPLVYENRSMQYYFGPSPSLAQPCRDRWHVDGHAHPGGLRAMIPVQTSGCPRGRYEMSSIPARVDEAPASFTQPAAERIVMNTARPGSRLNPIVMEDRGGFYERVASTENVNLLPRNDGVPTSSATMNPRETLRACPGAEPASYRSPSPIITTQLGHAGQSYEPSWHVDRPGGFVHSTNEDHRPQRCKEELRFQQVQVSDDRFWPQQPRQHLTVDDDCIFIRQMPMMASNHIDLTR
ncbi:hypothetical protein CP533_0293 [Ophiocordyceps camponoti-saundersi (nom. inval.)]|nr:hypothetical protein CP533_0293 [Ophiocordyceps camponoti-saundersi (nom. inval.)]